MAEASGVVEKKIDEFIALHQKWKKLYYEDFQRTKEGSEEAKKIGSKMDYAEAEAKSRAGEIREISKDILTCAEFLGEFRKYGDTFELWKPEEDFAIRRCKELLTKYGTPYVVR